MAKRNKKEDELKEQALSYLKTAIADNSDILDNAERNFNSYMMDEYGNEVDGRSKFVTSDVSETVEWIMPTLMRLFYGSQYVFDVLPIGPEDELKAKLMNAKLNHDFMQSQNGYMVLHDWFKSALMNKISAVKYWWEEEELRTPREYEDLTEEEVLGLREDPEVELDENTLKFDNGLFSVSGDEVKIKKYAKYEVLPPEEFIFNLKSRTEVKDADFVAHKKRVHKNYLKSNYKVKDADLEQLHLEFDNSSTLEDTRFEDLGGINFLTDDHTEKDFYFIYECYMNDYDSEGNKIPMKLVVLGNRVISSERNSYNRPTFCTLSSVRIPHRMAGMSVSDLVYEIQRLHTSLIRAIMDNVYYQNNGINIVNPFRINMDDVINRKEPGATWRTLHDIDPSSALFPVQPNPMAPHTLQMLDVVAKMKERRSGVNDYGQDGLSQQTLNKTAIGMSQVMSQAIERIEMIARLFAETGVRDVAQQGIKMNIDFMDQASFVKLDQQWAEINPEDIQGNFDVVVDVGVGTAIKEFKINQLMTILQTLPIGMQSGAITGENVYELYYAIYELMGYKVPDRFATKPGIDPQVQQMQQQFQAQIQQLTQMVQELKAGHDLKIMELELKKEELRLQEKEINMKYEVDSAKVIVDDKKVKGDFIVKTQKNQMDQRRAYSKTPSS
jgi:hypothetical protein